MKSSDRDATQSTHHKLVLHRQDKPSHIFNDLLDEALRLDICLAGFGLVFLGISTGIRPARTEGEPARFLVLVLSVRKLYTGHTRSGHQTIGNWAFNAHRPRSY